MSPNLRARFTRPFARRFIVEWVALGCLGMALIGLNSAWRLWIWPMPAMTGLIAVYAIWKWRRLNITLSYLRQELQGLADEMQLLPEAPSEHPTFGGDAVEQHIILMAQTAQRMQDMKRFVWDSLNNVPEPILVSDLAGVVLIANRAARTYFAWLDKPMPEGRLMHEVLGDLRFVKIMALEGNADVDHAIYAAAGDTAAKAVADNDVQTHWPTPLDPAHREYADTMARGIEVRDSKARDHLLRYAKCTDAQGAVTGWIAGLVGVSTLHAAERQREDALALLSHDMRSPQVSIVALVEIERTYLKSDRLCEVLTRIERYAQRALELADDFVQLTRAESQTYALRIVSLVELATVAGDQVWPQAQAKRIQLKMQFDDNKYWIRADPSLITRALVNILNNAVNYSPARTEITCAIMLDTQTAAGAPARVRCSISDQGYGISAKQQAHLFERFQRFHTIDQPKAGGTGLGMAFVKTVVTRHGGDVQVNSQIGVGTIFTVRLPVLDEVTE